MEVLDLLVEGSFSYDVLVHIRHPPIQDCYLYMFHKTHQQFLHLCEVSCYIHHTAIDNMYTFPSQVESRWNTITIRLLTLTAILPDINEQVYTLSYDTIFICSSLLVLYSFLINYGDLMFHLNLCIVSFDNVSNSCLLF